ncbi:hypothetical protein [Dactylosporangium sp. CA-139066]|uniref:hypothetical protein n=1 Tax=Dactylosporangium sp. CA-139066 TaxID=3239930 RepID=UPI003D926ADA
MTGEPFAFDLPDDAPPDLRAAALLGAGLAEVRGMLADLAEAHVALSRQVAEQHQQREGPAAGAPTQLRWSQLDRPGATALWLWLIDWVGWLNRRFGLTADLPACWPAHPPMVEELTALAAAWHAAYDPRAHPESPLRWLENFARTRQRLRGWDVNRCRNGTHIPPATDLAWPDGWRDTALDTAHADLAGRPIPAAPQPTAGEPGVAGAGGGPS